MNQDATTGGSFFYEVSTTGMVALEPGTDRQIKAMNRALQKGQSEIEASCAEPELLEAARKSAKAVLLPAVSATGWKIALVWR